MSKTIHFGHVADSTDEREYGGNISKRRDDQCQCDRGLSHGTCPGPANCPNSDFHDEATQCDFCGVILVDPCEDPPVDICSKAIGHL